jgi:hypothetical protein
LALRLQPNEVRRRRFGAAVLLLLCASPAIAGHGAVLFNTRRATPGIELELIELAMDQSGQAGKYGLRATGVPRGVAFDVWAKDFHQSVREIASGFRMDGSGVLVSDDTDGRRPQRLDAIAFGPGPYPRGAAWDVALVSIDRTIKAFARVIPHPIMAGAGPCTVSLELVSDRGDHFLATGAGFVPGEDVGIESSSAGQVYRRRSRISAMGLLLPDVISHAAAGSGWRAGYSVKGRSCEVALEYEWGEPALQQR